MTWGRFGDNAATYPAVLAPMEYPECDDRLVNELFGFVTRCALESAGHQTDYVISRGTAMQMAGSTRFDPLIAMALRVGLFSQLSLDDGRVAYMLVKDKKFIHLVLKAEADWMNQRKADAANPSLTARVRLRDGDACRWCGVIVDWDDRKSGRSATYDHLNAGEPAEVGTYVVCCRTCNSSRQEDELPKGVTQLRPPPDEPYFSHRTITTLSKNSWVRENGVSLPKPTAVQIDPGTRVDGTQPPARTSTPPASAAPSAPADDTTTPGSPPPAPDTTEDAASAQRSVPAQPDVASAQRSVDDASSAQRSVSQDTGPPDGSTRSGQIPVDRRGTESAVSGRDGSGRDGSGLVGCRTPAGGDGRDHPDLPVKPGKSRRGGRRRKRHPSGGAQ